MFAVIACRRCREPWAVETRHAATACPRCSARNQLRKRVHLWEGDDAREAQAAAVHLRTEMAKGVAPGTALVTFQTAKKEEVPRHDSPVDAAAAKARALVNKSERADAVALWLTRLLGQAHHDTYLETLQKAGIDAVRAEKEIVRMLATDIIYEPLAGRYQTLEV